MIAFYRLQLDLLWRWKPGRRALLKRALVSLVVGTISLLLTIVILPGLRVDGLGTIVAAVVLLAIINAFLRTVVLFLFASISTIAVIVATLVFQIGSFLLVEWLLPAFVVDSILAALIGSFIFAIFNTILSAILNTDRDGSYYGALVARLARENPDRIVSDSPGVVIIQIDGLAQPILAHQIRAGRVPFISKWVRSGEMKLDSWVALLPSQTSASQAGILHGNNSFIPAFRWWEKDSQRMLVSNHPADATEIVTRASNGEGLLSNDGASVGNLVSGDAVRSYITMATIRDPKQGLGQSRAWYSFFVSPDNYLRSAVLAGGEVIKEYIQASRVAPPRSRAIHAPRHALPHRASGDERAAPVAFHVAGDGGDVPRHADDLRRLHRLRRDRAPLGAGARRDARRARRRRRPGQRCWSRPPRMRRGPYKFILLSDHGQSLGATFKQRYGETLEAVIARLMGGATDVAAATGRVEEWGPINAVATEASRAVGNDRQDDARRAAQSHRGGRNRSGTGQGEHDRSRRRRHGGLGRAT